MMIGTNIGRKVVGVKGNGMIMNNKERRESLGNVKNYWMFQNTMLRLPLWHDT